MRVKKILARTLPEAMAQVKAELGPNAVILHTNEVRVGGLFGFFGKRMIQVTAAAEDAVPMAPAPSAQHAPALQPAQPPAPAPAPTPASLAAAPAPQPASLPPAVAAAAYAPARGDSRPAPRAEVQDTVRDELADMKRMMGQMMARLNTADRPAAGPLEPELRGLLADLTRAGVEEEAATALTGRVRSQILQTGGHWAEVAQVAREIMVLEMSRVETIRPGGRVVALVGPTGVGKTTTLAKLAAHFGMQRRLRVALITTDTYRIGAVDQLRIYSEILGVPLEVAYDQQEIAQAVARQRHRDLVLVDTAGRSPKNAAHMEELSAYLAALQADETYLVLSMTSGYREAVRIADQYEPMGYNRFLFTKWDETDSPGLIYSMVSRYQRSLSYITTGQNVPDDMETANPDKIARAILGG